jgi:hypothetical protein
MYKFKNKDFIMNVMLHQCKNKFLTKIYKIQKFHFVDPQKSYKDHMQEKEIHIY